MILQLLEEEIAKHKDRVVDLDNQSKLFKAQHHFMANELADRAKIINERCLAYFVKHHYIKLYFIISSLYYIILYYIILHILYYIKLYNIMLYYIILYYIIL